MRDWVIPRTILYVAWKRNIPKHQLGFSFIHSFILIHVVAHATLDLSICVLQNLQYMYRVTSVNIHLPSH